MHLFKQAIFLIHAHRATTYYWPYDYYYPPEPNLEPEDCAKLVPPERCFRMDCYNHHWPERDLSDNDTSSLPMYDEVSRQQLSGNCEPLAQVDRDRYHRCVAISHNPPTFAAEILAEVRGERGLWTDTNTAITTKEQLEVRAMLARGVKPDTCCRLTNHCYNLLDRYGGKDWYPHQKEWQILTCCLNLWELSCWGSGTQGYPDMPEGYHRPPHCSNPL